MRMKCRIILFDDKKNVENQKNRTQVKYCYFNYWMKTKSGHWISGIDNRSYIGLTIEIMKYSKFETVYQKIIKKNTKPSTEQKNHDCFNHHFPFCVLCAASVMLCLSKYWNKFNHFWLCNTKVCFQMSTKTGGSCHKTKFVIKWKDSYKSWILSKGHQFSSVFFLKAIKSNNWAIQFRKSL